ncbi:MAG: helix-turn-helix domain-containing protein [Thermodesulfobacteriota bacterium]|jgi:DNA-binding HxlR family transcriptional regulator
MTQTYGHFCPVARTLEKIGDKWSLLIIRDLLPGPQRFTDLLGYLNHITPKWLTQRLRELESSGIVERDSKPGRRQVWYHLTPAGRDLSPVVDALATWGFRYAMRPPLPGEVVHPELLMRGLASSLNQRGKRLTRPAKWLMQFPQNQYALSFDQNGWSICRGESSKTDLEITTTPETWAAVFTAPRSDRSRLAKAIQIEGAPDRIKEFLHTFGIQNQGDRPVPNSIDAVNKRKNPNPTKERKK